MSDQFVAEIRVVGFDFPPTGWAHCDGQIMPISQNTALFSLLGTVYGGDGKSTFALPNLQDSAPMQPGAGPGLSTRVLGEMGGSESVTLLESEMPAHTHRVNANTNNGTSSDPFVDGRPARTSGDAAYNTATSPLVVMHPQSLAIAGGSLPHNNMMPYLTLNFIIALQGVFPPRS
ncbi:MAG TPA: tail fiber protein [Acidimicrobiales bacterium]